MDKKELVKVYAVVKNLWQNYKLPENEFEDNFWYELFKGYDYKLIETALVDYAKQSSFFEPAKIVVKCDEILKTRSGLEQIVTEQDIYNEIDNAITRPLTESEWLEFDFMIPQGKEWEIKFNKLSKIAQKIVGNANALKELGMIEMDTFLTVTKSNILKVARVLLEKKEQIEKIEQLRGLPQIKHLMIENN